MIRRAEGAALSRVQYARFLDLLATLSPDEWTVPVEDCPGWTVKDVAGHVLGGLECVAKPKEFVRQYLAGLKMGAANPLDGLNAYQVSYYAPLSTDELLARLANAVEPGLRGRLRTPWLLRTAVRPTLDPAGRVPMGWILDVIYTRDTFVHRIDVSRAVGREMVVDDVEQRIAEDMAEEWAERLGRPVTLVLGDATYAFGGSGGERLETDVVSFARAVSGRGEREGLLATPVQV